MLGSSHLLCMVLRLPFCPVSRVLDSDSPNWYFCSFLEEVVKSHSDESVFRVFPSCNAFSYNSVKGITFSSVTSESYHSNKDILVPSSRNLGKNLELCIADDLQKVLLLNCSEDTACWGLLSRYFSL